VTRGLKAQVYVVCNKIKLVAQLLKTCVVVSYALCEHSYLAKRTSNEFSCRTEACCMVACEQLSVLDLPAMIADCAHCGRGAQRICKTCCKSTNDQVAFPVLRDLRGGATGKGGGVFQQTIHQKSTYAMH